MINTSKEEISNWFMRLQDDICHKLERLETEAKFHEDLWNRSGGGGGRTRVLEGQVIEKGGVNYSAVFGEMPKAAVSSLGISGNEFYATGVSIVLHPSNPHVPIIHMNVRYFEMDENMWWFGGGIDLTPHYIYPEDAKYFHQTLKSCCDKHDSSYYPKFKKWADDYFYIKHREETRGVGGIFFDRLMADKNHTKESLWAFVQDVGLTFADTYINIVNRHATKKYTEEHKDWQLHRRGRYVEFNLVWDRGTKFGLETGGRTESILMSLPKLAKWTYSKEVEEGTAEAFTLAKLRKGVDWL